MSSPRSQNPPDGRIHHLRHPRQVARQADGDVVKKDQPLFELETDKITSEGTAEAAGKITFKVAAGDRGEDRPGRRDHRSSESHRASRRRRHLPRRSQSKIKNRKSKIRRPSRPPCAASPPRPASIPPRSPAPARPAASPRATCSPPPRRSRPRDGPPRSPPSAALDAPVENPPPATGERQTRLKMTKLRQKIAKRLVAAQHEAAMLTTFNEVDMSAVMELRKKYQDDFVKTARRQARLHVLLHQGRRPRPPRGPRRSTPSIDGDRSSRTTTTTSASRSRPRRA
jgi:2-oxoglutarate dehydrogenase E2 component (dihydrolipoamide succinyltransferase)